MSPFPVRWILLCACFTLHLKLTLSRRSRDPADHSTCRGRVASLRFNDTKAPHAKSSWAPMIACRSFAPYTCCSRSDSEEVKKLNLMGASAGHAARCRTISEKFNCMPCHGDVGTGLIGGACLSLCDEWFDACANEFYKVSRDGSTIKPCFGDYLICSPLSEIVHDGASMCHKMDIAVSDDDDACYDGSAPDKRGELEPRPPNDDIEFAGFRFQSSDTSSVAQLAFALRKAWNESTDAERIAFFVCLATLFGLQLVVLRCVCCKSARTTRSSMGSLRRRDDASAEGSVLDAPSVTLDSDDDSSSEDGG